MIVNIPRQSHLPHMKPALDADHPAETPGIHHPHPTLTILIPNQNPTPGQCSFWEIHKES
jgi:hypothetical protein